MMDYRFSCQSERACVNNWLICATQLLVRSRSKYNDTVVTVKPVGIVDSLGRLYIFYTKLGESNFNNFNKLMQSYWTKDSQQCEILSVIIMIVSKLQQ